ncbi:MAG: metallophosphoesterase [Bacteroidaceae bacterium]|nr:metallophosphoesterase [Bacteroidaceae bacterium]
MHTFLFLIPLIYIAANIYLFCRTWQAMHCTPTTAKIIVSLLFWVVTFSMFIAIMLRGSELPEIYGKGLFRIGSAWLFFSCVAAALLAILDFMRLFFPTMQGNLWWAVGIAAAVFAYGNYNHRTPQAMELDITLDKKMDGELKMVVVSDLHLGYGTGKSALKRYVKLINDCKPDVIIIAGDLIDNSVQAVRNEHMEEELLQLQAPQGIYLAAGNHEHISGIEECEEFFASTNIKFLRDSVVTLPCGVQIMLRDDATNKKRKSLKKLFAKTDSEKPIVLVDHKPNDIEKSDKAGTDLHLSGHTHHGQVWPGNIITDKLYKQSHGYRKWEHAHVWVSSGLSLWGPPVRIGTRGDYAVITLRGKE